MRLTYRDREESTIEKHQKSGEALENLMLSDVEDERAESTIFGSRWYV